MAPLLLKSALEIRSIDKGKIGGQYLAVNGALILKQLAHVLLIVGVFLLLPCCWSSAFSVLFHLLFSGHHAGIRSDHFYTAEDRHPELKLIRKRLG